MMQSNGFDLALPIFPNIMNDEGRDRALLAALRSNIEYAFQPIVSVHTGGLYGVEALLRGHDAMGFANVPDLINRVYQPATAPAADAILRDKAMARFAALRRQVTSRLFLNIESSYLASRQFDAPGILASLGAAGIDPSELCLELSEARSVGDVAMAKQKLLSISPTCLLALDDFGVGHSGLQMLYDTQPNLIKIDRFFIAGINTDQRRKVFMASIVNLAHVLGIKVIAEGIETEAEFRVCREIGCDLAQGYWIQRPSLVASVISQVHDGVVESNRTDRRARGKEQELLMRELDRVTPIFHTDSLKSVFEAFRRNCTRSMFPVVDANQRPIGIIHESKLKEYVYSPFGKEILERRSKTEGINDLISPCITCEVGSNLDKILDTTVLHREETCVVIVDGDIYVGILHHSQLLRLLGDRNIARARGQNPLTQLPGNIAISEHIAAALDNLSCSKVFAYFDFNHFKQFNDKFGFRLGDRAITMFAELLRQNLAGRQAFLGHVGGDDFFAGWDIRPGDDVTEIARGIVDQFNTNALVFYPPETQEAGHVGGFDRSGIYREFPLLSVSCGVLAVRPEQKSVSLDQVSTQLAALKKSAKQCQSSIIVEGLNEPG
jgi:diguanylate cyclase (GGDEF)-like protein